MDISTQLAWLFIIAIPIATIAWTVTHEEIFREVKEYCTKHSENAKTIFRRKFFYVFTCEYCFSHYVTILILFITRYKLLFDDWRGYFISGFALVWVANLYMSLYALLRTDLKKEGIVAKREEKKLESDQPEK
jgi:hypothetical protein